jgi:hypothetical protein
MIVWSAVMTAAGIGMGIAGIANIAVVTAGKT